MNSRAACSTAAGFNEAPIHESGKFERERLRQARPAQLQ